MTAVPRFPSSWDEPYRRPVEPRNPNPFARGTSGTGGPPSRPRPADDDGSPVPADHLASGESAEVVGTVLDGAESPRQRELASRIYGRLKAGAEVDDVASLIDELSQAANEQSQRSAFRGGPSRKGPPRGDSPQPDSSPYQNAPSSQGSSPYRGSSSGFNPFKDNNR